MLIFLEMYDPNRFKPCPSQTLTIKKYGKKRKKNYLIFLFVFNKKFVRNKIKNTFGTDFKMCF